MGRFAGKNAIVTGSSRGIGASVAERLAAEGANVVVTARTVEKHDHLAGSLAETLARCRRYGTTVEAIAADLADDASRATIVPRALEMFGGRLDILVNNAAGAIYDSTLTYPLRRRRLMFEINVQAPIDLAQAAVPGMIDHGEGWIVNVSSATARHAAGPPFRTDGVAARVGLYGATKAALNRITNAFAVELDGTGVRINTIEPRAAVMSEGAEALVGGIVKDEQIESMEAMVEGVVALCDCAAERTGKVHVSLDLLDELGLWARTIDSRAEYPGDQRGQRVFRGNGTGNGTGSGTGSGAGHG
jgi:citronellol/citronellal dehydrogenase